MKRQDILAYLKTLKPTLQQDGIVSLGLFGSHLHETATDESDIDILIETTDAFAQKFRGWDAFIYIDENIRDKVANHFHKKVDIFDKNSNSSLKEKILAEVCYV
jgi:predicted nucleotidyltransferase